MALSHFSFRRLAALRNALVPGLLAVSACSAGESAPDATLVTSTASASVSAPAATHAPASSGASLNDQLATLLQASGVQCADANMAKGCTAGMSMPAISTTWSSRLRVTMRACLPAWRRQAGWMHLMRCRPLAVAWSPEPGWRRASSSAFKRSAAPDRILCITTSLRFLQTVLPDAKTTRHAEHMATGRSNVRRAPLAEIAMPLPQASMSATAHRDGWVRMHSMYFQTGYSQPRHTR